MHKTLRALVIATSVGCFALFGMGCENGQKTDAEHPNAEHPTDGEHPNAEHPNAEHPQSDHPDR